LTFSTSAPFFPSGLARFISVQKTEIGGRLKNIIEENGFAVNSEKVRLQSWEIRQEVTGLTTNKIVNVKRSYVRQIRAMLHAWKKFGYDAAEKEYLSKYAKKVPSFMPQPSFGHVVEGKLEFLRMVKGTNDAVYQNLQQRFEILPRPDRKAQDAR
jgi:RNA-directed DNA polymerase